MYGFLVLAFVASVTAEVMVDSSCPDLTPVKNFDFAAYGQGIWYEVARYPNSAEEGAECGWTEYTLEGDVTKVKNYHLLNNKLKLIEGFHSLASDADNYGKVRVNLPYTNIDVNFNILKIKYDDYLIGYYCKYDEKKKIRQDLAWVLSRSKTLSASAKAAVDKYLKESKVLDSSKFIWPSFTDEVCRIQE